MARIPGRLGMLYANMTSAGTPSPIAFISSWDGSFSSERFDVTAFGDVNKTYVAGLPDATGNFSGFYDDAGPQLYTAAVDGVARKFYFYPSTSLNTQYWFGTAFFDFNVNFATDGAATVSGSWSAGSPVAKVG